MPDPASPRAVLQRLRTEVLPAARARLAAIERRAAASDADATTLQNLLADACLAFFAMIDVYLDELIPARRGRGPHATSPEDPLEVRARAGDLDVLPATWDVASPPLSARTTATSVAEPATSTSTGALDDDVAATLLREWDDHLFALGLAPVRAAWLALGAWLGLGDDAFLLGGEELLARLRARDRGSAGLADLLVTRRAEGQRSAALHPPPRIVDGRPAGPPARPLQGMPIGPSHAGPIAQRRDLGDLQARPPAPGAIVVLPTLTAQAALVVQALGVRAVVCEWGGALSHAALIARELGLSALVGCRDATRIADGASAVLDTVAGRLRLAT